MKLKPLLATLVASALTFSISAHAESPDWNLIEIGVSKLSIEGFDEANPVGISIGASKLLSEDVFIYGGYSLTSDEIQGVDLDVDQASVGVGYRYGISETTDFYGAVSYQYVSAKISYGSQSEELDDNGYGLTAGLRSRVTPSVELDGNIGYVSIDGEGETALSVGAAYYFTDNIALSLSYSMADDVDEIGASLRYAF